MVNLYAGDHQSRCRTRVTSVGHPINEPLICRPLFCAIGTRSGFDLFDHSVRSNVVYYHIAAIAYAARLVFWGLASFPALCHSRLRSGVICDRSTSVCESSPLQATSCSGPPVPEPLRSCHVRCMRSSYSSGNTASQILGQGPTLSAVCEYGPYQRLNEPRFQRGAYSPTSL